MVKQGSAPGNDPLPHSVAIRAAHCRGTVATAMAEVLQPLFTLLPGGRGLELVKRTTVRTVLRGNVGGMGVYVKLFRHGALSDRARDALRGGRGEGEARNLLAATRLGLRAVEPLACGDCD